MSVSGIQGQLLEINVLGCRYLKDTQWISRQDPYVLLEYGGTKFSTRTCTDGDKSPIFQEKFVFVLIEGLREISVSVWNSNAIKSDAFIGSGKVQLQKVLFEGNEDTTWPLMTKSGRNGGELLAILHYSNAIKSAKVVAPSACETQPKPQVPLYHTPKPTTAASPSAPPCETQPKPQVPLYFNPAPTAAAPYPTQAPAAPYPPPANPAPPCYCSFPHNLAGYPSSTNSAPPPAPYPPPPPYPLPYIYPPHSAGHPASTYSAPPTAAYPPSPTPAYPPPPYPPPSSTYSAPPPDVYPPPPTPAYPPPPYPPPYIYPPHSAGHPPSTYSAPPQAAYPPPPYTPTSAYPPPPYPPPPQASSYYPPGSYPGTYP